MQRVTALSALRLQALGEALVEERSSIVEPALQDGKGPELRPTDTEPRIVEPLSQLVHQRHMTRGIVETPDGDLHFAKGGSSDRGPERFVLMAQLLEAQRRLPECAVEVVDHRQNPCHDQM
jgi:hypothetical protein